MKKGHSSKTKLSHKSKSKVKSRAQHSKKTSLKVDASELPRGRYVVGVHSAKEAMRVRPQAVSCVFLKKGWEQNTELAQIHDWAIKNKKQIHIKSLNFFDRICQTHQGLCLVVTERPKFDWQSLKENKKQIVLILDGLEDPHNLGAILRTAWLMGVGAVFLPKKQGAALTPTAIKVARGAAEHVPVIEEASLSSVIGDLKKIGFWSYALAQNNETTLYNIELPEKVAWVIGAEAKGVRLPVKRACDDTVSIPQSNAEASYNASVACAMALSETNRQHLK